MESSIFANTYRRYKSQTDKIAQWLLETAELCGYQPSASPLEVRKTTSKTNAAGGGRLKGRARKDARQQESTTSTAHLPAHKPTGPIFRIRLSDFVELASVIATAGPKKAKVPDTLLELVQRTVDLRRLYSDFYQAMAAKTNDKSIHDSNKRHSFFTEALEEVQRILRPANVGPQPTGKLNDMSQTKVDSDFDSNTLSNRFHNLQVYEQTELEVLEMDPTPGSSKASKKPPKPQRNVEYTTDGGKDSVDEMYFALCCHFEDLHRIQSYLQKMWEGYKAGTIELETASLTTNVALEIVQRMDKDFLELFPDIPRSDDPSRLFFLIFSEACNVDQENIQQKGDLFNYELADIGQWIYLPTTIILNSFSHLTSPTSIPDLKWESSSAYSSGKEREKISLRQKLSDDQNILTEVLADFYLTSMSSSPLLGIDELSKGVCDMWQTKKVPLWLSFAAQVYLDITHILGREVQKALEELRVAGKETKAALALTLQSPHRPGIWPPTNEQAFGNVIAYINDWILGDAIGKVRRTAFRGTRRGDSRQQGETEPFYMLTRNPLLCGTMQLALTILKYNAGCVIAGAWGSVLYSAHLYNALQKNAILDVAWPDMEVFISVHTTSRLFAGDLPSTLEECQKRCNLVMGAAPEYLAKDFFTRKEPKRKGKTVTTRQLAKHIPRSKAGPRKWQNKTPLFEIFKTRFMARDGSASWAQANIEALLDEVIVNDPDKQALKDRWDKTHQLGTTELLDTLKDAMAAEKVGLKYDYFSMHERCLHLLRTLRTQLHDQLVGFFDYDYIAQENEIADIVSLILSEAAGKEIMAQKKKKELNGEGLRSLMFEQAGSIVREVVVAEGDVESGKLQGRVEPNLPTDMA
ncbi:MAG: hypothetical protein Q9161_008944 [Pseudevernia consocians]